MPHFIGYFLSRSPCVALKTIDNYGAYLTPLDGFKGVQVFLGIYLGAYRAMLLPKTN